MTDLLLQRSPLLPTLRGLAEACRHARNPYHAV